MNITDEDRAQLISNMSVESMTVRQKVALEIFLECIKDINVPEQVPKMARFTFEVTDMFIKELAKSR